MFYFQLIFTIQHSNEITLLYVLVQINNVAEIHKNPASKIINKDT